MKQTYLKLLSGIIAVLALLLVSASVVTTTSANDNNHQEYQNCENQTGDHYGYQDDHEDNDCSKPEYCDDKSKHEEHEDNNCSEPKKFHYACVANACVKVEGKGVNTCNKEESNDCAEATPTPTPTSTPTPTPTPQVNTGGPGDGRNDGLGCASHDCSSHPQVLGASTAVLGLSTTSGENELLQLAQALGALVFSGAGLAFYKKSA